MDDLNFVEPLFLGRRKGKLPYCKKIEQRAADADIVIMIKDMPERSHVFSYPCTHQYHGSDTHYAICNSKESPCKKHFAIQDRLIQEGKLEPLPTVDDLREGVPAAAKLSDQLYWKFAKFRPEYRKTYFIRRIDSDSIELERKMREDLTVNKKHTYHALAEKLNRDKTVRMTRKTFKNEAKRYSFADGVGALLEILELVGAHNLSAYQVEYGSGLVWYMSGETTWNGRKHFVLELEENCASLSIVSTGTQYNSSLVKVNESPDDFANCLEDLLVPDKDIEIEYLSSKKPLRSSRGAFTDIANVLDEKRIEHYSEAILGEA